MDTKVFTDKVKITIKAGNGGDGMNSFKAYKGKPACGPDGGDGGDGGNIYFVGDKDMNDLLCFRFTSKYEAGNGERGGTNRCTGKNGADVEIKVPRGTIVRDAESGKVVCDVFEDGERILVLKGGRGGKGNVRFTTARRHAPNGRRTRGIPQRGQIHAAFAHFRGETQDRELPFHHAFAQSRRRAAF